MATAVEQPVAELARLMASCAKDPLRFMKCAYPWKKGPLKDSTGPRAWQAKVAADIRDHLKNPETRFQPCQVAVASGHDIGKSAFVAMMTDWGLSTCEDSKVLITANTDTQLRTKTWPEMDKWFKLAINDFWFRVNAESITVRDPKHERLWRADRVAWSDNNTEAFAGLHNKGKRIVVIFDEASSISDKIWEVTEGALIDEYTEIIWLCFGNPTRNEGRFRECFGKWAHRWKTYQIDSRTVEGTNKAKLQEYIDDYGEDSDFCRIRVRGEFPRSGSNQFIPSDVVAACRRHKAQGYEALPKILACDVARFGADRTVIGWRQGRKLVITDRVRGLDTVQVAHRISERIESERPDAVVVDGDGIGAGVIDNLRFRGYGDNLHEYRGGMPADDPVRFFNRRAESWGKLKDWLTAMAEIPDDPDLESDLTAPEYGFSNKGQIQLEKKDDMKKRGLQSPDLGDMCAMTFEPKLSGKMPVNKVVTEYRFPGQDNTSWMG